MRWGKASKLTKRSLCGTQENTGIVMLSKSTKLLHLLSLLLNRNKIRYTLINCAFARCSPSPLNRQTLSLHFSYEYTGIKKSTRPLC